MGIIAKAGASFAPCPAGTHAVICCDVVDLGIVESNYAGKKKKQHKVSVIWQTGERRDDSKFFLVQKRYTLSLHEKAGLRKDLEAWRGRPFTEEELQGFDVEAVIGVPCLLSIIHNAAGGNVYANVNALMRLPKGMAPPEPDPSYVRIQDRPKTQDGGTTQNGVENGEWVPTDDDVPF